MYPPSAPLGRVAQYGRGHGYSLPAQTGTIAAALAANSVVFAIRCGAQAAAIAADPQSALAMFVQRMRIAFTTITAFTTPITAGRKLGIYRASNPGAEIAPGATGSDITASIRSKVTGSPATVASIACVGTTAGITKNGLVIEAAPIAQLDLTHVGAAGARAEFLYEQSEPFEAAVVKPGEYLVISNPAAMDGAAGAWQLSIGELYWYEARVDDHLGV